MSGQPTAYGRAAAGHGVTRAPTAARQPGFLPVHPHPGARLRLFCFHHAGGSASGFADWQQALGPQIAVLPVQLPGREWRAGEPRITDMAELIAAIERQLGPWLHEPYAFYGHSMGALVGYALTRQRLAAGRPLPQSLLVGAAKAPHLPVALAHALTMPDDALGRLLVDIGGMSATLLGYPDWVANAIALIRDDLNVCTSNPYREPGPLDVPLHLFAGAADPLLSVDDIRAWGRHTLSTAALHIVPGGHFFPRESAAAFLRLLAAVLDVPAAPGSGLHPAAPRASDA